jgi:hypothetical protein
MKNFKTHNSSKQFPEISIHQDRSYKKKKKILYLDIKQNLPRKKLNTKQTHGRTRHASCSEILHAVPTTTIAEALPHRTRHITTILTISTTTLSVTRLGTAKKISTSSTLHTNN